MDLHCGLVARQLCHDHPKYSTTEDHIVPTGTGSAEKTKFRLEHKRTSTQSIHRLLGNLRLLHGLIKGVAQ